MNSIASLYHEGYRNAIETFFNLEELHPSLEEFKIILKDFNPENFHSQILEEINLNYLEYWSNSKHRKPEDLEVKLDAILFEYNCLDEINSKVYAYGLIKLKDKVPESLLTFQLSDYDFCPGFEPLPGFTLKLANDLHKLHWQNISEMYPNIEIYHEKGWNELMNIYTIAINLALSRALANKSFENLSFSNGLNIFIQEHDCDARIIVRNS